MQIPLTRLVPSRLAVVAWIAAISAVPAPAMAQSLDVVTRWNRIMLDAVVTPGANPPTIFVHRPMAIVAVAMFDAANSFDRIYRPYATLVNPAPGASRDAAVALADQLVDDRAMRGEPRQRARLVDAHEAAVAFHVRAQNGGELALHGTLIHGYEFYRVGTSASRSRARSPRRYAHPIA